MGAHVFVVDCNTFLVHRDFQFCGVVNPRGDKERRGLYADLFTLRKEDLVFFYQRRGEDNTYWGFNGVFEIADEEPFYDQTDIVDEAHKYQLVGKCPVCGCRFSTNRTVNFVCPSCLKVKKTGGEFPFCDICEFKDVCGVRRRTTKPHKNPNIVLPNRIFIKVNERGYFPKPVRDNYAYVDHTDRGTLWTMLFRKTSGPGKERSITHILPEEKEKLIRLITKHGGSPTEFTRKNYPDSKRSEITAPLRLNEDESLELETMLHAWVMKNIDKNVPVLADVIGPLKELEYFGAWVPYGIGGDTVDILCTHKRDGSRFKATVIELKRGKINQAAVDQANNYALWIAQLVSENANPPINSVIIQPVIIGFGKTRNVQIPSQRAKTVSFKDGENKQITFNPHILLKYKITDAQIEFEVI